VTEQSQGPVASSAAAGMRMKSQKRRDTVPERALRSELWRRGLRYRTEFKIGPGSPRVDIAFTRAKVAVFVDGCFWHSCPVHGSLPKANGEWWSEKLAANVARDRRNDVTLRRMGWQVIRVWEHEDVGSASNQIESSVLRRRSGSGL